MSLLRPFESAKLRLVLPDAPFIASSPDIFQMDIQSLRNGESFRLWKGHETNSVRVTDTDKGRRQLVLLVQEPPRSFEWAISKRRREQPPAEARNFALVRETESDWIFERWTTSTQRRYLCGMDERHLFIAEFQGGTTVKDAHRKLKPEAVLEADRSAPGRTLRQGEWFFVLPASAEASLLRLHLQDSPYLVRRHESLGGNGRPHLADEVVRLDRDRVYARGRIRHPDHKTLLLAEWRRVHRNAEVHASQVGANGVFWID